MVQAIVESDFVSKNKMAEDVGFEPTEPFGPSVFKTVALNHSANLPYFGSGSRIRTDDLKSYEPCELTSTLSR
jgi:hypothetical protein